MYYFIYILKIILCLCYIYIKFSIYVDHKEYTSLNLISVRIHSFRKPFPISWIFYFVVNLGNQLRDGRVKGNTSSEIKMSNCRNGKK